MAKIIYSVDKNGEWIKLRVDSSTTPPTIKKLKSTLFEKKHGYAK